MGKIIIQSFIANISIPREIEDFYKNMRNNLHYTIEEVFFNDKVEWIAPKWCKRGDIVFFYASKSGHEILSHLRKKTENYSKKEKELLLDGIEKGNRLYEKYGGKIFAIGRVSDRTFIDNQEYENTYWKGRIYAPIDNVYLLSNPIDISEFKDFIFLSRQSSITGVFGKEFETLKKVIGKKNLLPNYMIDTSAEIMPISKMCEKNWIEIGNKYRREFVTESQFRSYYTDFLLQKMGDQKTIYKECYCNKKNVEKTRADNVILIDKKYLPIEIKLNVKNEANIFKQLEQYLNVDSINITSERTITKEYLYNKIIVIDTEGIYLYSSNDRELIPIINLDCITCTEDVIKLKKLLRKKLNNSKELAN